jgi:hypothetical protein
MRALRNEARQLRAGEDKMKTARLFVNVLMVAVLTTFFLLASAHADVTLISPDEGRIFGTDSMIASYQPSFTWTASETFSTYNIRFSISPTDFKTDKILILSAQVPGTKYKWRPDITSWLKMMKKSYNGGSLRDIYWKVIGKKSNGSKIESAVWRFQAGPTQPVTPILPPDGTPLDSGIAPTFSFNVNGNVQFVLEFSPLADFSDPQQVVGFLSSRKDPNAKPVKTQTLSWDQWTAVKKKLGEAGYFRIRAWDAIKRETVSGTTPIQIYYFLVGDWDVYGTETIKVWLDGQSATDTVSVYDYFTFSLDQRRFAMIGLTKGKWKELPNCRYAVTFSYAYLAAFFERQLEQELGTDVTVAFTGFYMGGKEDRAGERLKGTMTVNMTIGIPSYGMSGGASIYATFTGTRVPAGYSIEPEEFLSRKSPLAETLEKCLKEIL